MTLEVTDKKTIEDIRKAFSDHYPFLKIEFYDQQHEYEEASYKKDMLPPDKMVGDIRKKHKGNLLEIYSWQRAGDVEQNFKKIYGLNIQIFYRRGDRWVQTAGSDELTLGEHNEIGYRLTEKILHGRPDPIERNKRL